MTSDVGDRQADRKVDEAVRLRDKGRERDALAKLAAIVEDHPNSSYAYVVMGGLYWDRDQIERAIECFRHATRISPELEKASLALFHLLYEAGDRDGAFGEMRRFLSKRESAEYRQLIQAFKERGKERSDD